MPSPFAPYYTHHLLLPLSMATLHLLTDPDAPELVAAAKILADAFAADGIMGDIFPQGPSKDFIEWRRQCECE